MYFWRNNSNLLELSLDNYLDFHGKDALRSPIIVLEFDTTTGINYNCC